MDPVTPRAWRTDPAQSIGRGLLTGAPPSRAWLWWLLAAAAAIVFCSQRTVNEPRAGDSLPLVGSVTNPRAAGPASLRLATLHLPAGGSLGGGPDLTQIAVALQPFDVVGLQGVQGVAFGLDASPAQALGEALTRGWLFAPATARWGSEASGVGLLSSRPLVHWQTIPLPGGEPAHAVLAVSPLASGSVRVLIVQVTAEEGASRQAQLAGVIALFESLAEPAALVGSLGVRRDDPQLAALLSKPGVGDAVYAPLGLSPSAGDWIITRGLRTNDAGVGGTGTAEHPLLWAELEPVR